MLAHRRKANSKRDEIGRGKFRWGPRVSDEMLTEVRFDCQDSLADHPSDDEDETFALIVVNGVAVERGSVEGELETPLYTPHQPILPEIDESESNHVPNYDASDDAVGNPAPSETIDISHQGDDESGLDIANPPSPVLSGYESPLEELEDMDFFDSDLDDMSHEIDSDLLNTQGISANHGVLDWATENKAWLELFNKHGLELTVMDDILKILRGPVKSWKTVIANICAGASLKSQVQKLPTCPGHMCFTAPLEPDDVHRCDECGSRRSSSTGSGSTSVDYIPILPRIQSIMLNEQTCSSLFQYHQQFQHTPGVNTDFYDSSCYQRIADEYGGKEGLYWDVFIAGSTDGFQAYKNRRLDVWPLLAILLNLPPEQRYNVKNVLPLMFIPDGQQPSNLQSFLMPLVNEVNSTLPEGVLLQTFEGVERRVRLHLVWFSTDLDALRKVASLNGHNGKTPCRFCLIQGVYCQASRHYYYPCLLRINGAQPSVRFDPSCLPPRTRDSITIAIESVKAATNATERNAIAKESGIKGGSVLFQVPGMIPYDSFPIDIMHLFYNVQKHLLSIQMGSYNDEFSLTPQEVEVMDSELGAFAAGISGQISPAPRSLSAFHTWKAAEHKAFTLSYCMVLFDGYLSAQHMSGLEMFVHIVDISFRSVLSDSDITMLAKLSVDFVKYFEKRLMRYSSDRLKMSTYVMHLILHLAEAVRENGPLVNYSQYWVERYIGWTVDRLNAKRLPAASMRNNALFSESYKLIFSLPFATNEDNDNEICEEFGMAFVGPARHGTIDMEEEEGAPNLRRLLSEYLVRKYDGMIVREAKKISDDTNDCSFWSKIRFPRNGSGNVQTVSISSSTRTRRKSSYIAAEMDSTEASADVYYGELMYLLELKLGLFDEDVTSKYPACQQLHRLAVINWARPLSKGKQQQVYRRCRRSNAFAAPTIEDASIIMRLIGVVEHAVPSVPKGQRGRGQRAQQRTYFIDSDMRQDSLLNDESASLDGVNRRLRGIANSGR